jgi:hypothetical protein
VTGALYSPRPVSVLPDVCTVHSVRRFKIQFVNVFRADFLSLQRPVCQNPETARDKRVPEIGNVTLKCNGVTRYRLCHEFRAITLEAKMANTLTLQ